MKINVKIGNTIKEIESNNYLKDRIDDYTGTIVGKRLDRTIRVAWFLAENPNAVIYKELKSSGIPLDVVRSIGNLTAEAVKLITETAGVAIASVEIYKDRDDGCIANDYAIRGATEVFSYNCEAAINAATDRALIAAGYFVPEELGYEVPLCDNKVSTAVVSDTVSSVENGSFEVDEAIDNAVSNSLADITSSLCENSDSIYDKIWNAENGENKNCKGVETSVSTEAEVQSIVEPQPVSEVSEPEVNHQVQENIAVETPEEAPKPKNFKAMSFQQLMQEMTYAEACNVTIPSGKFKGKTMLEMYNLDSRKVNFYVKNSVSDLLKASATIVTEGLNK